MLESAPLPNHSHHTLRAPSVPTAVLHSGFHSLPHSLLCLGKLPGQFPVSLPPGESYRVTCMQPYRLKWEFAVQAALAWHA